MPFEELLKARMAAFGGEEALPWIYKNDIVAVWNDYFVSVGEGHGVSLE